MNITAEKCTNVIFAALIGALVSSCGVDEPAFDLESYEAELAQWRIERLANLKGPTGYLNLVGLYWLAEGSTRIGSAADSDIVFPAAAAPYIGELQSTSEGIEAKYSSREASSSQRPCLEVIPA